MSLIYTHQKSKIKKKPGWQKEKDEYDAWLKNLNSMKLSTNSKPKKFSNVKMTPVVNTAAPTLAANRHAAFKLPSKNTGNSISSDYVDPRILYKESPEMLERELKAKDRKFITAPLYNKGGDMYVSEDLLKDITAGLTRRR